MLLLLVVLTGLLWWWRARLSNDLQLVKLDVNDFRLGTQIFEVEDTKDLQFFPAVNPKIHVSHPRSPRLYGGSRKEVYSAVDLYTESTSQGWNISRWDNVIANVLAFCTSISMCSTRQQFFCLSTMLLVLIVLVGRQFSRMRQPQSHPMFRTLVICPFAILLCWIDLLC